MTALGLNILKLAYSRTVYKLPSKVCRPCIMAKITVFWPKQYSLFFALHSGFLKSLLSGNWLTIISSHHKNKFLWGKSTLLYIVKNTEVHVGTPVIRWCHWCITESDQPVLWLVEWGFGLAFSGYVGPLNIE